MTDKKFRGHLGAGGSQEREPPQPGYDALMHEVCVGWGYCGCIKRNRPLHVSYFIPPDGPVTADQFVEWVFLADNLNPSLRPDTHRTALRAAFIKHMGGDVVDATLLKGSDSETPQ